MKKEKIGFENTGDLIKKIKRQLSKQELVGKMNQGNIVEKNGNMMSLMNNESIDNDGQCDQQHIDITDSIRSVQSQQSKQIPSQLQYPILNQNILHNPSYVSIKSSLQLYLQQYSIYQKDQLTYTIFQQYQKHIISLKSQLLQISLQNRQLSERLQNQRKYYLSEMYQKQIQIQEKQDVIQMLKIQAQQFIRIQQELRNKIKQLEREIKYLQREITGKGQNYEQYENSLKQQSSIQFDQMNMIEEEILYDQQQNSYNQDNIQNKSSLILSSEQQNNKIKLIRTAHQRQILKYQNQIKCLRELYENRLKQYQRKSITSGQRSKQKQLNHNITNNNNSIYIMDQFIFPLNNNNNDTISIQSHSYYNPHSLRHFLLQHQQYQLKQVQLQQNKQNSLINNTNNFINYNYKDNDNDNQSLLTCKFFNYPINNKQKDGYEDIEEDIKREGGVDQGDIIGKCEEDCNNRKVKQNCSNYNQAISQKQVYVIQEKKEENVDVNENEKKIKQFTKGITVGLLAGTIITGLFSYFIVKKK